ncbi:MAG: LamG-like jellyroll fold domain-containing protein, partial [Planctomycetota bacterium]|nr:LamG-like jellyroll fold domain-containing protein [Planctomycetota bacterium]
MSRKLLCLMSFVFVLVLAGNATAQPDPATVTDGHVYLLNDANFVDGTVPDSSAVGLAGNIVGEPYLAEGLFGKAMAFDGIDDGVHIPDSQFVNVTNGPWQNRTVMAVFNCSHVDKPDPQVVFQEGGGTRGFNIYVQEGQVIVGGWNKAEYQWNPGSWISAPIGSGEWHTVALVLRDGGDAQEDDKFEMWMDGELIGKAPGGQMYNHGNDNSIGYSKNNTVYPNASGGSSTAGGESSYFEGLVDEVWILNEALTPPQLAALAGTTWPYAYGPDPANGAELEEFSALLGWSPGDGAVSHDVYFGSGLDDVTAGAADTFMGNQPTTSLLAADLVPETTYYWRVDEVSDADPNNPSTGEVWSFSLLPRRAYDPDPADGMMSVGASANLTWTPGWSPIMHQVYFGTDPDQVANAADAPLVMDVGYDTGDLQPGTTYYWRVDEFYGAETVKGPVWSFTTIVYDEETPFDYDNSVDPFISEVSLDLDPAIDLTDPIGRIAVNYTGGAAPGSVTVDEVAGTTTIVGRGADIWGTADEFQYAYTTLTGNGSMTVKVDSLAHTNDWTKAGIMIRETLDAGSSFAMIAATGANGVRFQARTMGGGDATSDTSVATDEQKALAAPVWIKIERTFPMINAYYSTDGVTFIPMAWNPQVIPMTPAPIHIGLAVTSHSGASTYAEAVFSEISSDGGVLPGPLTSTEIGGLESNSAEPMYLVLEDASGASAAVLNPDPAATQQTSATDFVV